MANGTKGRQKGTGHGTGKIRRKVKGDEIRIGIAGARSLSSKAARGRGSKQTGRILNHESSRQNKARRLQEQSRAMRPLQSSIESIRDLRSLPAHPGTSLLAEPGRKGLGVEQLMPYAAATTRKDLWPCLSPLNRLSPPRAMLRSHRCMSCSAT